MSFEDRGKYITILSYMHQHGRLKEETIIQLVGRLSHDLKNKFKIDKDGFWYNLRLEEEMQKRFQFITKCRTNGKLGSRPSLEQEKKLKEEPKDTKYPFDEFWKMYDKRTDKQSCKLKWIKLAEADKELIFQRVKTYVEATPERQYRKNPLTYINKKIWLDELIPEPPAKRKKSAIEQLAETGSYE